MRDQKKMEALKKKLYTTEDDGMDYKYYLLLSYWVYSQLAVT